MAKFFGATKLTGGTTGALDDILHTELTDGDGALVIDAVNNKGYKYTYESSNASSESTPDIIKPDSNTGNGRWVLVDVYGDDLDVNTATIGTATVSSLTLASGATATELSTDGTFAGDSDTAVPTEKASRTFVERALVGYLDRPQFTWSSTSAITIGPGTYHHSGTTEQLCYWDSDLTFTFGSGGTNADSTDLAGEDIFYLYLDDSAIVTAGTRVLTATEFVAVSTEPTWSNAKRGWYNGNDRCIAGFWINSSNEVSAFYHTGELMGLDNGMVQRAMSDLDTTEEEVILTIPAFTNRALLTFIGDANGDTNSNRLAWRTKGSSTTNAHQVLWVDTDYVEIVYQICDVITNNNKKIEVNYNNSGDAQARIDLHGYYFAKGT